MATDALKSMDEVERSKVNANHEGHLRRFEAAARRAQGGSSGVPVVTPLSHITEREIEVLQLIAHGLTNEAIGKRLFIATETVKKHIVHLLAKLEADNRSHAVAVGFRRGLIR